MSQRIVRIAELASTKGKPGKLPASPATVWRGDREGRFLDPLKLGQSITIWTADEVKAFIDRQAGSVKQ